MKFSGKIWFMIILKVTKKQGGGVSHSLWKTHFWKNHRGRVGGGGGQDRFRVLELNWNKILWNNKVVTTGESPFFVTDLFCTLHSICLNIGFWRSGFVRKCCVFSLDLELKSDTPVFWKRFTFFRKFTSKLKYWKRSKFPVIFT